MARNSDKLIQVKEALRKKNRLYVSDFLDENEQAQALELLKRTSRSYRFDGGYDQAQRKILIIAPEGENVDDYESPLVSIVFKKPCDLNHRNVLGTLMSLGVERDTVGDIAIWKETVQVVILERLAEFFINNFNFINGIRIYPVEHGYESIIPFVPEFDEESVTAASNRIDAVAAGIFKTSRKKVLDLIHQERLSVNHLGVAKVTAPVSEGDILVLRGKGKVKIKDFGGKTKKGRIRVNFLRYK